ncbi:hypothetical protein AXG93_977s1060 [Marchantia polymorpha subsp. ruderalis]|uniref:Uncharacterized protein n=1 Tax=Marchantia polymorpha subsp. ruderalis TaxID=1480154 RepID=A0A176WCX9_MARPO|nr:hypothetical protein AXG93_977s1060 [Marchantia polymorpha subsp. ruderalis]
MGRRDPPGRWTPSSVPKSPNNSVQKAMAMENNDPPCADVRGEIALMMSSCRRKLNDTSKHPAPVSPIGTTECYRARPPGNYELSGAVIRDGDGAPGGGQIAAWAGLLSATRADAAAAYFYLRRLHLKGARTDTRVSSSS